MASCGQQSIDVVEHAGSLERSRLFFEVVHFEEKSLRPPEEKRPQKTTCMRELETLKDEFIDKTKPEDVRQQDREAYERGGRSSMSSGDMK